MPMTVITLKLYSEKPVVFGSFSGFSSRGLFYELVKGVDEEYARSLHSSGRLAPFSSSPALCLGSRGAGVVYRVLPQDSICMVRFVVFDEPLAKVVLDALLQRDRPLKLSDAEVSVVDLSVSQVEYSEFVGKAKPVKSMVVEFLTPTFFRFSPLVASKTFPTRKPVNISLDKVKKSRRFHPVPEPILLMRSLVRIWRAFSNRPFNYPGYLSWISSMGVSLAGYPKGIRTIRVYEHPTTNKFVVGFVGAVNFSIPEDLYVKKWAAVTDALLRFAEYSNVGGGRTAGFGMVRYLAKDYYVS